MGALQERRAKVNYVLKKLHVNCTKQWVSDHLHMYTMCFPGIHPPSLLNPHPNGSLAFLKESLFYIPALRRHLDSCMGDQSVLFVFLNLACFA